MGLPPNTGFFLANDFFDQLYGTGGVDTGALTATYVTAMSGVFPSGNPPYGLGDFAAVYPKFFGVPVGFAGSTVAPVKGLAQITQGSPNIVLTTTVGILPGDSVWSDWISPATTVLSVSGSTVTLSQPAACNGTVPVQFVNATAYQITVATVDALAAMQPGQVVTGPGIPKSAVIANVDVPNQTITLTDVVTASYTGAALVNYPTPVMPVVVLQMFILLANASLVSAMWQSTWTFAMSLYIAHFCTLWMRSETGPNTSPAQIVQSGLQVGILTSKSAGDVSASIETLKGFLDAWGDWNLTSYGLQFATLASSIGSVPVYVGSTGGRGGYYGGGYGSSF